MKQSIMGIALKILLQSLKQGIDCHDSLRNLAMTKDEPRGRVHIRNRRQTMKILGLDIGVASIGWAYIKGEGDKRLRGENADICSKLDF